MLNALLYTFILYHILFLLISDAFMCVHCIVFYSSATEALINNNNNNNRNVLSFVSMPEMWRLPMETAISLASPRKRLRRRN